MINKKIFIAIFASVSMLTSIFFQFQIFGILEIGPNTDFFVLALMFPQLMSAIICPPLLSVLVPEFSNRIDINKYFWNISFFMFLILCILSIFIISIIFLYIKFSPNYENKIYYIEILSILLISGIFTVMHSVILSALYSKKKFIFPEISLSVITLSIIIFIFLMDDSFGVFELSIIITLRSIVYFFFLTTALGFPEKNFLNLMELKNVLFQMKLLISGGVYFKTEIFIDRYILSTSLPGELTYFYICQQLYGALHQIFNKVIANPFFEKSCSLYENENKNLSYIYMMRVLKISICLILLLLLLFALFGSTFYFYFFNFMGYDAKYVPFIWEISILLFGVLIGGAISQILVNTFYSTGDLKTPVKISIFTYSFAIILKFSGFYSFGIAGFALATSSYYLIDSFIQFYFIRKSLKR